LPQTPQMPEIIFDTNVLSNFSLTGRLDLLRELYPASACCTFSVVAEINSGLRKGRSGLAPLSGIKDSGWPTLLVLTESEQKLHEVLLISLGEGESSCIAVAAHRNLIFACDDRLARKEAARLTILLTGTIGILMKAIRLDRISNSDANELLQEMVRQGFYSPIPRIEPNEET
jgi:predicted nucleic acid-binding protein